MSDDPLKLARDRIRRERALANATGAEFVEPSGDAADIADVESRA
jgi:hypothetical protein